jgi:hypothetical protein
MCAEPARPAPVEVTFSGCGRAPEPGYRVTHICGSSCVQPRRCVDARGVCIGSPPTRRVVHGLPPPGVHSPATALSWANGLGPHNPHRLLLRLFFSLSKKEKEKQQGMWTVGTAEGNRRPSDPRALGPGVTNGPGTLYGGATGIGAGRPGEGPGLRPRCRRSRRRAGRSGRCGTRTGGNVR